MKKLNLILFIILVANQSINFGQDDSTKTIPFQASIFYPLGTNGFQSKDISNHFSFNLFYGINGGLNGAEIGGLVNTNLGPVNGFQLAGISNINTEYADGIIIAGISNIIKDSSKSICIAGISNIVGKSSYGLQVAGISNTVNGDFSGIQTAGILNANNGAFNGLQIAGISNANKGDFIGGQISGISNINFGDLKGAQIGLINKAKKVDGFQLGLINIADSFSTGIPLGLLSFVKKGYHAIELGVSDAIMANINVKLGVSKFYNIYKLGYTNYGKEEYFSYGFGVGSKINITKAFNISADFSANHIINYHEYLNFDLLNKADFALRVNLGKYISFFGGPSLNVYLGEFINDNETTTLKVPYTLYNETWWNNRGSTSIWIGAHGGISFNI